MRSSPTTHHSATLELRRWRAHGVPREELERRRQGLMSMRFIESDAALFEMFAQTGRRCAARSGAAPRDVKPRRAM